MKLCFVLRAIFSIFCFCILMSLICAGGSGSDSDSDDDSGEISAEFEDFDNNKPQNLEEFRQTLNRFKIMSETFSRLIKKGKKIQKNAEKQGSIVDDNFQDDEPSIVYDFSQVDELAIFNAQIASVTKTLSCAGTLLGKGGLTLEAYQFYNDKLKKRKWRGQEKKRKSIGSIVQKWKEIGDELNTSEKYNDFSQGRSFDVTKIGEDLNDLEELNETVIGIHRLLKKSESFLEQKDSESIVKDEKFEEPPDIELKEDNTWLIAQIFSGGSGEEDEGEKEKINQLDCKKAMPDWMRDNYGIGSKSDDEKDSGKTVEEGSAKENREYLKELSIGLIEESWLKEEQEKLNEQLIYGKEVSDCFVEEDGIAGSKDDIHANVIDKVDEILSSMEDNIKKDLIKEEKEWNERQGEFLKKLDKVGEALAECFDDLGAQTGEEEKIARGKEKIEEELGEIENQQGHNSNYEEDEPNEDEYSTVNKILTNLKKLIVLSSEDPKFELKKNLLIYSILTAAIGTGGYYTWKKREVIKRYIVRQWNKLLGLFRKEKEQSKNEEESFTKKTLGLFSWFTPSQKVIE